MAQMIKLTTGDNVKPTTEGGKKLKDGEIAVGFHGETEKMRDLAQSRLEFTERIANGGLAVNVGGRSETRGNLIKGRRFADDDLPCAARQVVPGEVWRKFGGIDIRKILACFGG